MKTIHKKASKVTEAADKHFVDHPVASVLFNPIGSKTDKKQVSDFIRIKEDKAVKSKSSGVMFFSVSLCLSLLMVIYAFEWRTAEE